jgi:hypothetical protein
MNKEKQCEHNWITYIAPIAQGKQCSKCKEIKWDKNSYDTRIIAEQLNY